eukprot:358989-Chlamydomonas_euryale.AAC.5
MDFSDHFNCPAYSDVVVKLSAEGEAACGGKRKRPQGDRPAKRRRRADTGIVAAENRGGGGSDDDGKACGRDAAVRVLYVHRIMLSKSPYFKGRLSRCKQPYFQASAVAAGQLVGPGARASTGADPAQTPGGLQAAGRRRGCRGMPGALTESNSCNALVAASASTTRIELMERMRPADMDAAELVLKVGEHGWGGPTFTLFMVQCSLCGGSMAGWDGVHAVRGMQCSRCRSMAE